MSLAMACGGQASSPETGTEPDGAGLNGSATPAEIFSHVTVHDAAGHSLDLQLSEGTRSEDGTTTQLRVGVWERSFDLTRRHSENLDTVTVEENGEPLASATFGAAQGASSQPLRVFDRQGSALEPSALASLDPVAAALLTPGAWQTIDARFSALSDYTDESGGGNLSDKAAAQSTGEEAPQLGTASQALSIGTGAISTGGLNAWGCWSSCCESTCTAGHYEPDCCGRWIWVCDSRSCTDPCDRCIWPY